ncbi:MAG: hypothetical protein C0469_03945 [Cyanobacteria bacterium DS2.3.42]|nr:hypothetical protein [Cyanobacteria bacterium DS2.3.42]
MQKLIRGESTECDSRTEAMIWIENLLTSIAESVALEIDSWKWDICGTGDGGKTYQLVLTGRGDKRAIKLFTANELEQCLTDLNLQAEFSVRLTPLVIFVGSKVSSKPARKSTARRRK